MMRRGRKICIVTTGQPSTNPRVVKEADALSEAGYEVRVIGASWFRWADEADRELMKSRAWSFEYAGGGTSFRRAEYFLTRIRHKISKILASWSLLPARALPVVGRMAPELWKSARRWKADLYIAHYLPALAAAAEAAKSNGALLAFDAEDFHSGEFDDRQKNSFAHRLAVQIEREYLKRCDFITASAPGIARVYAERYGVPLPTVILNVFPRERIPAPSGVSPSPGPGPSLYWFSQVVGPTRGLEEVVTALGLMRVKAHVYMRGFARGEYVEKLRALAQELGVRDQIHFFNAENPAEMVRQAAAFDAGLSIDLICCENRDLCISNKILTYLLAGIPVIAGDSGGGRDVCKEAGEAVRLFRSGDARDLAQVLDRFLSDPGAMQKAREAARAAGCSRFNWEAEKPKLLAVVDACFGKRVAETGHDRP